MAVFKCKMCGGTIEFEQGSSVGVCDSCGTKQTLPRLDDDKKSALYDRANHFRRNNEFDKAMGIYEQILNEDNTDSEAYWSLVLCKYGIDYVEDPTSHKRIPTVNRAQYTAIFDDENYKSALQYADEYQREIYEEEARQINEIQKGILAISQQEDPFDVFICYKETDNNGRRTPDSVLANDLYYQLTQEGFKVFFSRITLEDKLGTAYEPYIFAALNSAKVMVVLGTKPEHFNAVWVKNEWSRYLALVKQSGGKKVLIPAYRDMDPYDLPEEFSHLQAQDMSKLGFMQDLIRGIKKIAQPTEQKIHTPKTALGSGFGMLNTDALIGRALIFLEDGEWENANEYAEKVLDVDPENAHAYLVELMSELRIHKEEDIALQALDLSKNALYKKAFRYAGGDLKKKLENYYQSSKEKLQARLELQKQEELQKISSKYFKTESEIEKKRNFICFFKTYAIYAIGFVCSMIILMVIRGYADTEEVTALIFGIISFAILGVVLLCLEKNFGYLKNQITYMNDEVAAKGLSITAQTIELNEKRFDKYDLMIFIIPTIMVCTAMLVATTIVIPMSGIELSRSWMIENACVAIGSLIGFVLTLIFAWVKRKMSLQKTKTSISESRKR